MKNTRRYVITGAIIALFIFCAIVVTIYAVGYKIDIENRNITKTALIDINVSPSDSEVYLNGNLIGKGSQTIRNLDSGEFTVEVKKQDYQTFTKKLTTRAGDVTSVPAVDLFLVKPNIVKYEKSLNTENLNSLSESDSLASLNGEIRFDDELITRFSKDIFGASWYTNRQYVAFTNDSKLKMIRVDGTNLIDLFDKSSQSPVAFTNSGKSVIYEDKGQNYIAQIR